jgi:hypothetical protein
MKRILVRGNAGEVKKLWDCAIFICGHLRMISFDRIKRKSIITSISACLLCSSQSYFSVIRLENVLWLCVCSVMFEKVCKFGDLRI